MQLIPLPSHPVLHVPADIRAQLDRGAAEGRALAAGWVAGHPDAPVQELIAFAQGTVPLPPEPAQLRAELARIHRAQGHVSDATMGAAEWFSSAGEPSGRLKPTSWWTEALTSYRRAAIAAHGEDAGLRDATRAAQLLQAALEATDDATFGAKHALPEPRPYTYRDGAVPPPGGWTGQDAMSHPSGHASRAWTAATVLGRLWPAHAGEFTDIAAGVAHSRLLEDMHFPHDVAQGARLGALIGAATLAAVPADQLPVLA